MKSTILMAALATAALSIPASGDAALLQFTLTGSYETTFLLDSEPVPDISLDGIGFTLFNVAVPGTSTGSAELTFFGPLFGGGLNITDAFTSETLFLGFSGAPIYGGTEDVPSFSPGSIALINLNDFTVAGLTISTLGAPVPEPKSWALLVAGFGLVGGGLRARQRARADG